MNAKEKLKALADSLPTAGVKRMSPSPQKPTQTAVKTAPAKQKEPSAKEQLLALADSLAPATQTPAPSAEKKTTPGTSPASSAFFSPAAMANIMVNQTPLKRMEAQTEAKRRTSAITPTAITYQERQQAKMADPGARTRTINATWDHTKAELDEAKKRLEAARAEARRVDEPYAVTRNNANTPRAKEAEERARLRRQAVADAKKEVDELELRLSQVSGLRYEDQNQQALRRVKATPEAGRAYTSAKGALADKDKLDSVLKWRSSPSSGWSADEVTRFQQYEADLRRDYGLTENDLLAYAQGDDTGVQRVGQQIDTAIQSAQETGEGKGMDFRQMDAYERRKQSQEEAQKRREEYAKFAKEHPVLSAIDSVASIPASMFQGADIVNMDWGRGDPGDPDYIPPDTSRMKLTDALSTTRGTVAQNIQGDGDNLARNFLSFLYETGMSAADSASTVALLGPGSLALMGTNAAVSEGKNIIDRGGTREQAILGGLASGAAEVFFEKFSVDQLLKPKDITGWKSFVKEGLKQGGVEASEEMATEIANIFSDTAIMGANSDFQNAVRDYMADGKSEEEAKRLAYLDQVGQVALSGLGGFLSGGMTGALYNAPGLISHVSHKPTPVTEAAFVAPEPGQIPPASTSETSTPPTPTPAPTGPETVNAEASGRDPLMMALFGTGQEKTASAGEAGNSDPLKAAIQTVGREASARNFRAAMDKWDGNSKVVFDVGKTSTPLQSVGVKNQAIRLQSYKVNKILDDHPGMTMEIIKQAPDILEKPVLVAKSKTHETRIVVFGEVFDTNGAPVLAALELQPTTDGGEVIDVINLSSLYGKDKNPTDFIRTSDIIFLDPDNNRTEAWLQRVGLQLPSDATSLGPIGSVTYEDGKVKITGVPIFQTEAAHAPADTPESTSGPVGVGAAEKGFAARQAAAETATSRVGTNQFPYNQRRGVAAGMTREEYTAAFRYSVLHEEDSMRTARGLVYHPEDGGEVFLLDYDPEGFAELVASLEDATAWNAPQQDAAHLIERELFGRSLNGEITEEQYANFLRIMREKNTAGGQGVQANAKWTRTDNDHGEQTRAEAWELLQKADMTDEERQARFAAIVKFDARIEDAKTEEELRSVILDIARERGTLSRLNGKEAKTLVAAAQWGVGAMDTAELRQFAYASSAALTTDVNRADLGQKVRTIQVLNMLSSPRTPARNITGNTTFYALDALTMNAASILDAVLGKLTGTQSMAWEKGLLRNKAKREALMKGIRLSLAEVTMDVDMGSGNRYAGGKRTFKADGILPERVMSVLERNMGYLMTVPDELYKGMARSQAGALQAKIDQGKIKTDDPDYATDQADDLALYRTFQKDGVLAGALQTVHDWMNIVGVGNSGKTVGKGKHKVHSFGLGDLTAPFTRVAGNLVQVGVDYNPVKAAQGVVEITKVVADAVRKRPVDPKVQAKAVSDTTRGLTGTALAIGVMMLASAGLVKRADDEDNKKVADMNRANGVTGTQINLTAAQRALAGGSTQWQAGDTLVDLSSIEPLNLIVDLGVEFANMEDYDESDGVLSTFGAPGKVLQASVNSTIHAAGDLPVLDTVSDFATDVTLYGENPVDAFASAIARSVVSSVTPNVMASAAKGMDDKQRDLYAEKGLGPELWAYLLSRIPGARETLPVKENPATGEEKENPGDLVQRMVRAMLSPIGVNTYQGQDFGGMSAEDWGRMFAQVDADKSKSVSKAETMAWIEENVPKEQWHEVFETYKGNRNWKNPY